MGDSIVENWLKSLDLEKYAQAFVDNGYDDLEICKQVGDPDLDAIGVASREERCRILDAVKTLKEKGGTAVYLTLEDESSKPGTKGKPDHVPHVPHVPVRPTLENLLSDVPPPSPGPPPTPKRDSGQEEGEGIGSGLIVYQKMQLTCLIRDKLTEDRIDLASPPYTAQNWSPCWSSLTALAVKYAEELHTMMDDVLDRLEDLRWWRITEDTSSIYTPPSMTSSTMEDPYNQSLYSYSPRGGPPPIPSVPPPDGSHVNMYGPEDGYGQLQSVQTRYTDNPSQANYVALDTGDSEMSEKKKTSTLGRLFRNMGFRRSSRKHTYKKHSTKGDLVAHEITMSDNDRIALMQMVKEGKISTETALQVVKRFEEERKQEEIKWEHAQEKEKKSKSKKSGSGKPTKSPSLSSTDDSRCDVCRSVISNFYPTSPGSHQWRGYHDDCCRHQRVHSVSHISYPGDSLRSPGGRAMSCSPMRSHSTQPSVVNSPVNYAANSQGAKIYTPVIPHELKMYSGSRAHYAVHGIDLLRDRLNVIKTSACVHKTQSKASLISSESDHSMDFASPQQNNQLEPTMDETYFCSNNSTTSMGSDTIPGANGRRKCGNAMEKLCTHKWQRTGSLSQGEDGMSTDNDELDDADRFLLPGGGQGGTGTAGSHVMDKFRGVRNEMRRRILHTKDMIGDGKTQYLCSAYQAAPGTSHSVSSNDSCCSSGLGSQSSHNDTHRQPWATEADGQGQGLVQQGQSQGQPQTQGPWMTPIIGLARVHSNYSPAPEEKDFLHLRQGERVQIIEISSSGIWKGRIDQRVGYFHFNFVDMVTEATPVTARKDRSLRRNKRRSKPKSVEDLLQRINLEHLTPVFMMNGYDNLEIFAEIDHEDLNALNILDSESRTKLVTAANLLMDYEDLDTPDEAVSVRSSRSTSATPTSQQYAVPWTSFFPSKPLTGSRDSGCYDSSECMSREHDPYACLNRNRILGCIGVDNNKENHRPVSTKKNMKLRPPPDQCLHNNGAILFSPQNPSEGFVPRLERIYSEEDQEVCNITGFQSNTSQRSSPRSQTGSATNGMEKVNLVPNRNLTLNIPVLGPDWKIYADAGSQTSPKYGSLSDSYHSAVEGDQGGMSVSAHGDMFGQRPSTLRHRSKPFARKMAPVVPMKDVQVQVMCPLGLFPQQFSPSSPPQLYKADNTGNQSDKTTTQTHNQSEPAPTGSVSLVLQNGGDNEQTVSLVKLEHQTPTRTSHLSQSSQNSRDGDSGSDASTVKSDIFLDGREAGSRHGSSTPDALFGPIHKGFKSIKRSVIPKVTSKLASENIDLAAEPYSSQVGSTQTGGCGIPPLLVQRYAEELKQDLYKMALILDQIRIHKLTTVGRTVLVSDQLMESSLATSELKISSITEFFISIGLPMYAEAFVANGYTTVDALVNLSIKELQAITKADRKHLKRIIHALEWVQSRLTSPSRKAKSSPMKDRV